MRKIFVALAALLLIPASALAQSLVYSPGQQGTLGTTVTATCTNGQTCQVVLPYVFTRPGNLTPLGYQQITSLSAATALTVPAGATVAYVIPETQAVRWRDGGTNPTATVGQPLAVGQQLEYRGTLSAIKFIEQTASAKIDVVYY